MELFLEGVMSLSVCLRGNSLQMVTNKTIFISCNVKGRGLLCKDNMYYQRMCYGLSLEIQIYKGPLCK